MLNPAAAAELIVQQLELLPAPITDRPLVVSYWTAVCTGLFNHMKSDAVILPTALLDSFNGQVTGTGKIT